MTAIPASPQAAPAAPALFAATTFASAGLVFLVQPMVAKLVLPLLGGSPSVWSTSMVFFQAALLAGYGYAHLLQRLPTLRLQAWVHCAALALAAVSLPLQVSGMLGPPSTSRPILWLLGVLALSVGAPFAALSATAPLAQAWYARTLGRRAGREPYPLYAASNLGSLLALLAYPALVEPSLALRAQRLGWSWGYGGFLLAMVALAVVAARAAGPPATAPQTAPRPRRSSWAERLAWGGLAAIPSSLMLGVTTHITTDVASAPFLWVIPLALYLLTFVIAFQARSPIPPPVTRLLQAATVPACAALLPFSTVDLAVQFAVHLAAFFFAALMSHQTLVARRPDPVRLTEFYLWISIGGVAGGAFNALLAPAIFDSVWEYPLILTLSCLARPWGPSRVAIRDWVQLGLGLVAGLAAVAAATLRGRLPGGVVGDIALGELLVLALITAAVIAAFLLRRQALLLAGVVATISIASHAASDRATTTTSWRSFFGVLRESSAPSRILGEVRMLTHGTTLHGAQAGEPFFRCRPLLYYAPPTPIGQVFSARAEEKPALRIGAVGLGAGSVAAYVGRLDHLTFFEIDPLVVRIATDRRRFSYLTECARGEVDIVLGDARLTLARQPPDTFDILLIDAFSSDAVPSHLLTVEAVRSYLARLKPDGVLLLHLSNRHLDLNGAAQAVAVAAGGQALLQEHRAGEENRALWESDADVLMVARSAAALQRYAGDRRWKPADPSLARPWTDDYVNLPGALWRRLRAQHW